MLQLAAAAERGQDHPDALAILAAAEAADIEAIRSEWLRVEVGSGLRAQVHGGRLTVDSARLTAHAGLDIPAGLGPTSTHSSVVYVGRAGEVVGLIELATPVRDDAREVVDA